MKYTAHPLYFLDIFLHVILGVFTCLFSGDNSTESTLLLSFQSNSWGLPPYYGVLCIAFNISHFSFPFIMPASSFHHSSTRDPTGLITSPSLSGFSRPITSCLLCRSRKVKCDRRQPLCLVCERGNYACSYVSRPQSLGLASGSSRITKPSNAPKISSSTLAQISPGLQHIGNSIAQVKAYTPSEYSFAPTSTTPVPHDASPIRPRLQEDALFLDDGVPHFVSGKHWA